MEGHPDTASWVREGIITRDQADAIETFEHGAPPAGLARWHPFWLHVTVFMAAAIATFGAVLLIEFGDFAALPLGVTWFLLGAVALASPWTFLRDLPPLYHEALLVSGAVFLVSGSALTPSEDVSHALFLASIPILAAAFVIQTRPAVRLFIGLVLLSSLAAAIDLILPDAWEPQIIAFAAVAASLVLVAWQLPAGPYRRSLWVVAGLLGGLGLGTGLYAIAGGSRVAVAAVLLSAVYLGVVWGAWTGRIPARTLRVRA